MKQKFIDSFKNIFATMTGKVNIFIDMTDLEKSRYISLYKYHKRKRSYREFLEQRTLEKLNDLLPKIFTKNVTKEVKKEVVDCTVIFLKWITINYDYWPGDKVYNEEFNRIIIKNVEKLKNN